MALITLKKQGTDKAGNTRYTRDGVRASIYFNKGMFATGVTPPDTIELSSDGLAEPGEIKVSANLNERAEKAIALAEKQAERARKAVERAEKLKAQLAAKGITLPATAAPATEEAPAVTE
jgi:hypothetical protein